MALHRKISMRSVVSPPIALSTFNDMMADGRVDPPDGYVGRWPVWSDQSRERLEQSLTTPRRRPARPPPPNQSAGAPAKPLSTAPRRSSHGSLAPKQREREQPWRAASLSEIRIPRPRKDGDLR